MKMRLAVTFLVVAALVGMIGCAGKPESQTVSLQIALVAAFVSEESVEGLGTYLETGLPAYHDDSQGFSVVGVTAGDSTVDPMSVMAGSTQIAAMLGSGEIDVWICDPESAKRYADNGANYIQLDTLFSAQELNAFVGSSVGIPVTDDEGNRTDQVSPVVGIDLSLNAAIVELTGITAPLVFVLAGSTNLEAAKAVLRFLAN